MRIAIIGGGFSGSAVAINILRRSVDEIILTLLERGDTVGNVRIRSHDDCCTHGEGFLEVYA
jgi:cation diffusion facilitator CzcD-associated flavoprotein CzcO